MDIRWTKHLRTEEEKNRFHNTVMSAKPVLERVIALISEWEESTDKSLQNPSSYDSSNWALKAADRNGFNRAISNLKQLINLRPTESIND